MITLVDERFDHHADDGGLTFPELVPNDLCDFWLVAVVFVGVTCENRYC